MNILLTFDDGYIPHAAVVMESIISNCKEAENLTFYILHNELSIENQDILRKHFVNRVNGIFFIKVENYEFRGSDNYSSLAHIKNSKNVLLRLFLDKIPSNDWILYLDCDVIVQDDVTKLEGYYDSTKVLAAVTEYNAAYKMRDLSKLAMSEYPSFVDSFQYEAYWYRTLYSLGMDLKGKYFCAGVMLINLKLWKEQGWGNKVLDYILKNPIQCFALDQDALNHQANGDYIELPPRWGNNVTCDAVFTNYSSADLEEAIRNPAIIHVAGSIKPWMYRCSSKHKELYYKYRKSTPWPELIYPDKTLINIVKSYTKVFRKLFGKMVGRKMKHTMLFFLKYEKRNYFSSARIN